MTDHHWIVGADRRSRLGVLDELVAAGDLPGPQLVIDAHRRLRGPYTAGGSLIRALVPEVLARTPELVPGRATEILCVAPELEGVVPAGPQTLTSLAVPEERTRYYSRLRTRRIAHGLAEFLRDLQAGQPGRTVVIENLDQADPTDVELAAVLLRRLDPARLALVIGSAGEVAGPVGPPFGELARRRVAAALPAREPAERSPLARAAAFVRSDGTSDDPALLAGYAGLDPARTAALHDARADELDRRGEFSLRLGAIAWHREHGSDPAGSGVAALKGALEHCIALGFYDATVDAGTRGRALVDPERQFDRYWAFTAKLTMALSALGRAAEAEALYDELRALTTNPQYHLAAAYTTAMLYTRHHDEDRKDHLRAKGWANTAIAFALQLPDPKERAFQVAFNRNGLALVEVHLKHLDVALELVDAALAELDAALEPTEHRLHRSVLVYNRAQVHAGLGHLAAALADYDAVIGADPNYSEYHFERGNLHRRAGDLEAARVDYDVAIRTSPPYPEAYYNRADVLVELGQTDAALADFSEVIELDPEHVDARINRAGLLLEVEDGEQVDAALATATADVEVGLALAPGNPHLLLLSARLADQRADADPAEKLYAAALEADPRLVAAWTGRAVMRFGRGDVDGALRDLDNALRIEPDPVAFYNRGVAHQSQQDWAAAVTDFTAALELAGDDLDLRFERARSHAALGHPGPARADLEMVVEAASGEQLTAAEDLLATLPPPA